MSPLVSQAISFVAQIGVSYMLGRLTARDGPRLNDLSPASGEYGVALPRVYGGAVRLAAPFLAQDEIKETEHEVEDYSEVTGAISGAATGFMIGGPIGAGIGALIGGIFGAGTPNQKYYTYSVTMAVLLADRSNDDPIEGVLKLWANGRVIFNPAEQTHTSETLDADGRLIMRQYAKNKYFGRMRVYGGGADQAADSILTSNIGAQPGYRHRAYVVLEDLQLEHFGNSVPPVEGLVAAKTDQTLADLAGSIAAEAGIDHIRNLSTTALTNQTIRGYAITSETTCWDALKPILPVYRIDAAEVGGQIRFYTRAQAMRATIPTKHMGAHEFGNSVEDKIEFARTVDTALPRETSLTFIDPARDYQANTASSQRSEGDARSNVAISLALTLTADEGATAAATAHWDAWLGRTKVSFSLTDQWIGLSPGVAYGIQVAGSVLPYRITNRMRGANGIIEVEAVSDESVTYVGTVTGSSGAIPPEESTLFADTRIVLMDMPMFQDAHDDFGFYVAMAGTKNYWSRGYVQVSADGVTYGRVIDATGAAVMGDVTGTLAAGSTTGLDDTLDTTTVLTVELLHSGMTLASTTDAKLDAWDNFAFVGKDGQGEYLQFKTATNTSGNTWELTDLRRGRRGTDHAIGTHAASEQFVLLGKGGIYRIPTTDNTGWGDELTFRGVTLHQDVEDADLVTFTNTGEGKRPFSPINLAGSFDGSNNLALTWDGRARFFGTDTDTPITFEIDIKLGGVVVRTVSVTPDETYTYTAADQTTDGFTEGDSIQVDLYRVNDDYGRSRARTAFFVNPAYILHLEDGTTEMRLEDDLTPIELG